MTNNQSLLERWAVVLSVLGKSGCPTEYVVDLENERLYDQVACCVADTEVAIIAVLEKWLRYVAAPWVEGETGPIILFPHMSGDSLRWMIAGVAQGRNDDTDLAHLELAEAICDYLETSK